jgi:hypothetical protein
MEKTFCDNIWEVITIKKAGNRRENPQAHELFAKGI